MYTSACSRMHKHAHDVFQQAVCGAITSMHTLHSKHSKHTHRGAIWSMQASRPRSTHASFAPDAILTRSICPTYTSNTPTIWCRIRSTIQASSIASLLRIWLAMWHLLWTRQPDDLTLRRNLEAEALLGNEHHSCKSVPCTLSVYMLKGTLRHHVAHTTGVFSVYMLKDTR
jgi:hypothetical protein